ncbi:MAG: response regulator [Alphaproteobacteria bacterium]
MERRDFESLNVLVVDDNHQMLTLIKSILHSFGIKNMKTATDGADAFKELRYFAADVVICDWSMSPLDGFDFVRLVRTARDSPNVYVPIIMLTGHTELDNVMHARDAGVNEFLAKPLTAHALQSRIEEVMARPRRYVRAATYFGPDRRRRKLASYRGPERRLREATWEDPPNFRNDVLHPDEVEELLKG